MQNSRSPLLMLSSSASFQVLDDTPITLNLNVCLLQENLILQTPLTDVNYLIKVNI